MTASVTVDIAGAWMGGAARYAAELREYLARTGRDDVRVIGTARNVSPTWLLRRELFWSTRGRRVAVNNVSFISPGGQRWTLLRNALHFLTENEAAQLTPAQRASVQREAGVVRFSARRADMLVVPSTAMAERVSGVLPAVQDRVVVRAHPVSAGSISRLPRDRAILCPVLLAPYKQMDQHLTDLLAALDENGDSSVMVRVTADAKEIPVTVACHPRIEFLGRLNHDELRQVWARSQAIYFPTGLESFGYPLAEARANGLPVIAQDSGQNKEIAGAALCGFLPGDRDSLCHAVKLAMTSHVPPDPAPFDPDSYFDWLLRSPR